MRKNPPTQEISSVPHSTSTEDFENYLPTSPVLSSRGAGWQHMVLRTYDEPADLEETYFPGGPDIYLVLVTSGHIQAEERKIDGPWRTYPIHAGDWFLTPAGGESYGLRWKSLSSDPHTTIHLHLNADLFFRSMQQLGDFDPTRVLLRELTGFQDELLAHLGYSLQRELQQPDPTATIGQLYAETATQMLIAHLLRHYTTKTVSIREYSQKLSSHQMRRLRDFILAHLSANLSLEMLAQQVGFSPYHFARLFRHTTGESPHQFVLHQRLEAAKHLLKATNLPLADIALRVGFHHQSHFTQAFRRSTGTTPLIYRQQR